MKYLAHRCDKCLRDAIVGLEGGPQLLGSSFPVGWIAVEIEIGRARLDIFKHITESIAKASEESVSKSPADVLGAYMASAAPLVTGDASRVLGRPYRLELCENCAGELRCELGGISLVDAAQAKAKRAPQVDAEFEEP